MSIDKIMTPAEEDGVSRQRIEIERRPQVEERYADVEQGAPVAIGGED